MGGVMRKLAMASVIFALLGAGPVWAKKPADGDGVRSPGMDIGKILGDGYEVPPELSSRAKPGTIIVWDRQKARFEAFRSECVRKTPNEYEMTNVSMKSNLAGGVRMNVGPVGGGVEARTVLQLQFNDPVIVAFEAADVRLQSSCRDQVNKRMKTIHLSQMYLVQEAILARISGCTKVETTAKAKLAGRGAYVQAGGSCEMYSNEPVVVGLRLVPVGQFDGVTPDERPPPEPVAEVPKETSTPFFNMWTIAGGVATVGGGAMVLTTTMSANNGPANEADFQKLQMINTIGWGLMLGGVSVGVVPYLSTGPMLTIHGAL
jgi:hypothetical protein